MRAVDRKVAALIRARRSGIAAPNTRVEFTSADTCRVLLHGHQVAVLTFAGREVASVDVGQCGWCTSTTHTRLNDVLSEFAPGWGTFRKRGEGYISGPDGKAHSLCHLGRFTVHLLADLQVAA